MGPDSPHCLNSACILGWDGELEERCWGSQLLGEMEDPLSPRLTRALSFAGMSHEPKSPSLGMLSTATRTTATVSPLTPSPLNGSIVPNGSPAASSTLSVQAAPSSSFAAALRKLAKQAEEPRGGDSNSDRDRGVTNTGAFPGSWSRCFPAVSQLMPFPGVVSRGGSLGIQFIRSNPSAVSLTVPWETTAWQGAALLPPTTLLFPEVAPICCFPSQISQLNSPERSPALVTHILHHSPLSLLGCGMLGVSCFWSTLWELPGLPPPEGEAAGPQAGKCFRKLAGILDLG